MGVERAQVAIVGASAAGLAAAIASAEGGANTVLVEARPDVSDPPAPAIVGFDHLWPAALPAPAGCARRRLVGVHVRASSGTGLRVDAPLTLFDRARLDEALLARARKAGARVLLGAGPVEARADGKLAAQGVEIHADLVVFADGARSQASRFLRPVVDADQLAWGAILDVEAPGDADRLLLTMGPHAPGGRSQLNPLGGGRWSHWTFFRGDPRDAEALARRAFALDARLQGWKEPRARYVGVAPDPVYQVPRELARGRVAAVGGAAGQGGLEMGLASGWMVGEAAARAAQGAGTLEDYARAWGLRYQNGYVRLRQASDALARLTDEETRALLAAWEGARLGPDAGALALARHPRGALAVAWAAWLAWARA